MQAFPSDRRNNCFSAYFKMLFVPSMIMLGLLLAFIGVITLKIELFSLLITLVIYGIYLLFVPHNAIHAACKMESEMPALRAELDRYLHARVVSVGNETKSLQSPDAFLSKIQSELRNENFSSVAPSIFPMLGILGTFIGIAFSMPDFGVEDSQALDIEIARLLSGVGTAFYASIFGIFLSIWWTFMEKRGLSRIGLLLADLEQEYAPRCWEEKEVNMALSLEQGARMESLLNLLSERLSPSFAADLDRMTNAKVQLIEHSVQMQIGVIREFEEKFSQMLDAIAKNQHLFDKSFLALKDVLDDIATQSTQLSEGAVSVHQAFKGLSEESQQMQQKILWLYEQSNQIAELFAKSTALNLKSLEHFDTTQRFSQEHVKSMQETLRTHELFIANFKSEIYLTLSSFELLAGEIKHVARALAKPEAGA